MAIASANLADALTQMGQPARGRTHATEARSLLQNFDDPRAIALLTRVEHTLDGLDDTPAAPT